MESLRDRYRCIVPELPFGTHTTPMPDDADFSPPVPATLFAEFLTELDLRHVTLVCNDWGGAQLVVSPGGTDRVANLVLVSCEAFDNYPPGVPGRLLCLNAALPGCTSPTARSSNSPRPTIKSRVRVGFPPREPLNQWASHPILEAPAPPIASPLPAHFRRTLLAPRRLAGTRSAGDQWKPPASEAARSDSTEHPPGKDLRVPR